MKISASTILFLAGASCSQAAFMPHVNTARRSVAVRGYLDDLTPDLYAPSNDPDVEKTSKEATDMAKDKIENFGPAGFDEYVDFGDEFDGGDGQMGVAGDGNKSLEKLGAGPQMGMKSNTMSAKNAWGTDTGYAKKLVDKGIDTQKAQRLENWQNQRAVRAKQVAHKELTENFDKIQEDGEADWRTLAQFGVERNSDFDMDEEFGPVVGGDEYETISLKSRLQTIATYEFMQKNDFMGFADFRCAFTADTNSDWKVSPQEGALKSKEALEFVVKFKPSNPGTSEATLVIDTEDMKKTWKFIGTTG